VEALKAFKPRTLGARVLRFALVGMEAHNARADRVQKAHEDYLFADIEYEVNVKAEMEVAHLHEKTDRIYENMLARFTRIEKMMRN